jgi:SAM-dependent methyltransferase
MNDAREKVHARWIENLESGGYDHHVRNVRECRALERFSRVWRIVFRTIGTPKSPVRERSIFEVGCGGGKHLVPFALAGWRVVGIDLSPEVLERAGRYFREIESVSGHTLSSRFIVGDFFTHNSDEVFDIVFHAGVIEHFLDEGARIEMLTRMFALTKPGGYVVSIVPSGFHPFREELRQRRLGGYDIPEIDYTPEMIRHEFERVGGADISILPNNLFGYLLTDTAYPAALRILRKLFFYIVQVVPASLMPRGFALRHAYSFIGIARKSL